MEQTGEVVEIVKDVSLIGLGIVLEKGDRVYILDGHKKTTRALNEKAIKVDVDFVARELSKVKQKVIGKNHGNLEIENILNRALTDYGIFFQAGDDSESTTDDLGSVGLISASIDDYTRVYLNYFSDFYTYFDEDYVWNDFIEAVAGLVYHELVHRYQLKKIPFENRKSIDPSGISYLTNSHEVMAHAQQFVFMALRTGYTKNDIKQKLRSADSSEDFIYISAFWKYWDWFGRDAKANDDKIALKTWDLFLKYSYAAID